MMFKTVTGSVVVDRKASPGAAVEVNVVIDEIWAIPADRDYVAGELVELCFPSPMTIDAARKFANEQTRVTGYRAALELILARSESDEYSPCEKAFIAGAAREALGKKGSEG